MFFQSQSAQKLIEKRPDQESNSAAAGAKEDAQIPRLYQREDIFEQGSQMITSISLNTVFRGNIDTQDDVAVFGRLEGDILNGASIRISGTVKGDIRCDSLQAFDGTVEGSVWASGGVELSESSHITGNLQCDFAVISGTINGDLSAVHGVTLSQTAVINGNLHTAEIEIQKGAKFNGMVEMGNSVSTSVSAPVSSPVRPLPPKSIAEIFPTATALADDE